VKVYPAPPKNPASYFFASFFLTLTAALCGAGLFVAYDHSVHVGSGRSVAVFALSQSGGRFDVTLAGNSFFIDTASLNKAQAALEKLRKAGSSLKPAPLQLAEFASARLDLLEEKLLSQYGPYQNR
jgi:hypothetical protein